MYISVPQVVPIATETTTYNGTSVIVNWIPVEDTRETVMGRVAGYRVKNVLMGKKSLNFNFLITMLMYM